MKQERQGIQPRWAVNVEAILAAQGRTKVWLAQEINVGASMLAHLLHGDPRYRDDLSDTRKANISHALGVPVRIIFGDSTEGKDR